MINPVNFDAPCHGGSCHFRNGEVAAQTAYDMEEILIVEV